MLMRSSCYLFLQKSPSINLYKLTSKNFKQFPSILREFSKIRPLIGHNNDMRNTVKHPLFRLILSGNENRILDILHNGIDMWDEINRRPSNIKYDEFVMGLDTKQYISSFTSSCQMYPRVLSLHINRPLWLSLATNLVFDPYYGTIWSRTHHNILQSKLPIKFTVPEDQVRVTSLTKRRKILYLHITNLLILEST